MVELVKSASVTQAVVSDIITYKLEIKNNSDQMIRNIIIKDLLPEELKFIIGSVKVDYTPDNYSNIISGVSIGDLEPNAIKIITFDATIIKRLSESVSNNAIAEFKYSKDGQDQYSYVNSNIFNILIKNPKIVVFKESDKSNIKLDEEINYKITISNTGDLDVENVFLLDTISPLVTLIDGTFKIDGVVVNSVEINKGVSLNHLSVGEQRIINYTVKVESGGCSGKISNKAYVRYSYTLPEGSTKYKESNESDVSIDMLISSFKQISIDKYINIHPQKPDIQDINDIKINIDIDKYNVVKTPIAKSSEGQNLSGYKLVIHGTINQMIEYIAFEPTQSIHSTHYTCPFSTYIILPKDFKIGNKVDVEHSIENTYFEVVDDKCFFENITILLVAKVICS